MLAQQPIVRAPSTYLKVETSIIETRKKKEIVDITPILTSYIEKKKIKDGILVAQVTHTTCCLTTGEIGEGTDDDLLEIAQKIIPDISFRHGHNPSHAWTHMASSIIGSSLSLIIKNGKLILGTWQSVLLMELDGPRQRKISVAILSSIS